MRPHGECFLLCCPRCQHWQTGEAAPAYGWVEDEPCVQLCAMMGECLHCAVFLWPAIVPLICTAAD
jgi:hypothetical protein